MSTNIKIFYNKDDFEINKWIKENDVNVVDIKILQIVFQDDIHETIMVIYKPN